MSLSKHFRFCLWWGPFVNGGHFLRFRHVKKLTPVTFFLHMRHVFLRPGVISLRRKMTPRSIFDGGRYSSLHRPMAFFISPIIRYTRAWSSYECFILRARRLFSKLLKQGYLVERLKSSFKKFYGRYGDLI